MISRGAFAGTSESKEDVSTKLPLHDGIEESSGNSDHEEFVILPRNGVFSLSDDVISVICLRLEKRPASHKYVSRASLYLELTYQLHKIGFVRFHSDITRIRPTRAKDAS
jgi:hypothetical protein